MDDGNFPLPVLQKSRSGRYPKGFYFEDTVGTVYYVEDVAKFAEMIGLSAISVYKLTSGKINHLRGMRHISSDEVKDRPVNQILKDKEIV